MRNHARLPLLLHRKQRMKNLTKSVIDSLVHWILLVNMILAVNLLLAADWPTYQNDNQRSCVTTEQLNLPLNEPWQYISKNAPQPAWPPPAITDYWHREANIKPRVIYDRAFHVVSAGDALYFGSSTDDHVYCLDAATGQKRWSYATEGPVRLAPTIYENKIYVGSDDGRIYCLESADGKLVWDFKAAPTDRLIPGNERIISICPVRTSVLVENDIAYFAAGMFPNEGVNLYAVDAENGVPSKDSEIWVKKSLDISPQGYLLASATKLYVPTGRTTPFIFQKKNGKPVGHYKGTGGAYAILKDDVLLYGGGDLGSLEIRKPDSKDQIAAFRGVQMIMSTQNSYLRSDNELAAIDRQKYKGRFKKWSKTMKKRGDLANDLWDARELRKVTTDKKKLKKLDRKIDGLITEVSQIDQKIVAIEAEGQLWKISIPTTYSMIKAGEHLILGGDGKIQTVSAINGKKLWSHSIKGKAYSLSVANRKLFVSTDQGIIHCFAKQLNQQVKVDQSKAVSEQKAEHSANPFPDDELTQLYQTTAKELIEAAGIKKGYCLVLDANEGRLAYELARQSELKVIGIEVDAKKVARAREKLVQAGLYGPRISLFQGTLKDLPFTKYFANLIVSDQALIDGTLTYTADELYHLLRPFGGKAILGGKKVKLDFIQKWQQAASNPDWKLKQQNGNWATITRAPLLNSGEWTHIYADASNSACSMDSLKGPVQIQWFGRPGPRNIINRHSRPMSPLFKDGRLFVTANNQIIAVDAYNGTRLWDLEVPNSRILGALKDFGHIILTQEYLYIAVEAECWVVDVATGKVTSTFEAPQFIPEKNRYWGYLSTAGDQLFGTGKKPTASYKILARLNCTVLEGDFRDMIISDYLFSVDRFTGKKLWLYRNGVMFNNTITVGKEYVYFIESRNERSISDEDGRLRIDYFTKSENYLVKLDRQTGKKIYEKPFKFPFNQIMYLSYAKNILLAVGSYNVRKHVHYGLFAFDANSGDLIWKNSYKGDEIGGEHGEQWQHPVIIDNTIVQRPYAFDLKTGKKTKYQLERSGGGCGGLSGSTYYLYGRGSNPQMYQLTNKKVKGTPLTRVNRPGCWINIIPAGGLVMIPESSSGCTCDYPIQTSFVFIPK